jgi:hypothetical protein
MGMRGCNNPFAGRAGSRERDDGSEFSAAAGTDSRGWSACREPPSTFSMMASVAGPGRSDPEHPFPPMTMDSLPTVALATRARCETSRQVHQLCPSAALRRSLVASSRGLAETQPCFLVRLSSSLEVNSCAVLALADRPPLLTSAPARLAGPSEATSCRLSTRDPPARGIATDPSMGVELARMDAREVPPEANRQAFLVAHPNARTGGGTFVQSGHARPRLRIRAFPNRRRWGPASGL